MAMMEIVWHEDESGALAVKRLVDRDQSSIWRYDWADDRSLQAIVQRGVEPVDFSPIEIAIPLKKLWLLTYRLRRREYHGRSILRPAYRHYFTLDMITRFADIGLEHSLAGTPVGRAPANYKQEDLAKFQLIIRALRRHEASGLVLPPGWDLVDGRQLGGNDDIGFLPYIQWHEGAFLRAALVNYMQLGSTQSGTTDLGGDLIALHTMGLGGVANLIAATFTRQVLRPMCDYNTKVTSEADYPVMRCQPISDLFQNGARDTAGQFMGQLAKGQVPIPADPAQRSALVKEGLGLP
jgi:hypothetical protein